MRKAIQSSTRAISYSFILKDKAKTEEYLEESKKEIDTLRGNLDYLSENFLGDTLVYVKI